MWFSFFHLLNLIRCVFRRCESYRTHHVIFGRWCMQYSLSLYYLPNRVTTVISCSSSNVPMSYEPFHLKALLLSAVLVHAKKTLGSERHPSNPHTQHICHMNCVQKAFYSPSKGTDWIKRTQSWIKCLEACLSIKIRCPINIDNGRQVEFYVVKPGFIRACVSVGHDK